MSGRTFERYDWQVPSSGVKLYLEFQPRARSVAGQRPGFCTWRTAWPVATWFVTRTTGSSKAAMVDFVRRPTGKQQVRPELVVPVTEALEFLPKG